ncbi:hypothetical protein RN04_02045 [Arthrobacter sp. W1]|nr:hypothetical protein RN04_02045 [Arthrobacter sp. W1]
MAVAAELGEWFEHYFERLDALHVQIAQLPAKQLSDAVRDAVRPWLLDDSNGIVGAGYIGEDTGQMRFEWWLAPMQDNPLLAAGSEINRLQLEQREYADYVRDYRNLEWYSAPHASGRRHITGPFVDHLCICDYVLTLTIPVTGSPEGIVGLDLRVRDIEPELLRFLLGLDGSAALASAQGRVITSSDPRHGLGALLSPDFLESSEAVTGTSLLVVRSQI